MKKKRIDEFTTEEKNWMDTIAVNYIIAQSGGYQAGYAQAISDFTEFIVDYWNMSDDKPQQSVLDAIADLGNELHVRQQVATTNIETAEKRGFEKYYTWDYKPEDEPFGTKIRLYTKVFEGEEEEDE